MPELDLFDVDARDGFERYYAEKLWELVPPIYRHEDGLADNPNVLRALIEVLAGQAAILRRSHDRLWEDQFIELCDDWAVPYLAELVGTRLVSALNARGRRVDVAKTIYYRRRKGTLAVLEELIADITGWEGTVVESFRRLGRAAHRLDPPPAAAAGTFSATPPGGWADIRNARAAELTGGPFEEFHRTPDVRRQRGSVGRFAIPRLAFHLYRLAAYRVGGVNPAARSGALGFTFDPSGRDAPLFAPRQRPGEWSEWRRIREWELPAAIPCRLLGHAEYELTEAIVLELVDSPGLTPGQASDLRTLRGIRFRSEARLRSALAAQPNGASLLAPALYQVLATATLVEACGKSGLLPAALAVREGGNEIPGARITAGNLAQWSAGAPDKRLVIDPVLGRMLFVGAPPADGLEATYHHGFSGPIGAGSFARPGIQEPGGTVGPGGGPIVAAALDNDGVATVSDSATYGPVASKGAVRDLTLQAADRQRPYLLLDGDWALGTGPNEDSLARLDGLWIGASVPAAVILRGDYQAVTLRHVTLDPGGARSAAPGDLLPAVSLIVEGHVELLTIEASICGPIFDRLSGSVERLVVKDSIVQSLDAATPALAMRFGTAELTRVTLLGGLTAHRLAASETLVTGEVRVTDAQWGCFRFSAAAPGGRLPRQYMSHTLADSGHLFTSRRFGDPGFGQLSQAAPEALRRGAENGSEIGAFSSLLNPIKLDGLKSKVDEFLPFGLVPMFIRET